VQAQALRDSLAPSSFASYAKMYLRFRASSDSLSTAAVVSFVSQLAQSTARPMSSVLKFRAVVSLVADAAGIPSPFDSRLLARVAKGLVRVNTADRLQFDPLLDMAKVLRWLRAVSSSPSLLSRAQACACVAAQVPSRPVELSSICLSDLSVSFAVAEVGHPNREFCPREDYAAIRRLRVGGQYPRFTLFIKIRNTKTDKDRKDTVIKSMTHPSGCSWSPAAAVLDYACSRSESGFVFLFGKKDNLEDVSVSTISSDLASVALAATGVRVSAKFWRSAAATWLLLAGLDVESVASLGGWSTTESLRKHYIRSTWLPDRLALAIAGISELSLDAPRVPPAASAVSRAPPSPTPPKLGSLVALGLSFATPSRSPLSSSP